MLYHTQPVYKTYEACVNCKIRNTITNEDCCNVVRLREIKFNLDGTARDVVYREPDIYEIVHGKTTYEPPKLPFDWKQQICSDIELLQSYVPYTILGVLLTGSRKYNIMDEYSDIDLCILIAEDVENVREADYYIDIEGITCHWWYRNVNRLSVSCLDEILVTFGEINLFSEIDSNLIVNKCTYLQEFEKLNEEISNIASEWILHHYQSYIDQVCTATSVDDLITGKSLFFILYAYMHLTRQSIDNKFLLHVKRSKHIRISDDDFYQLKKYMKEVKKLVLSTETELSERQQAINKQCISIVNERNNK